jgi:NIMA (never in mitosis gene a)-related kinase
MIFLTLQFYLGEGAYSSVYHVRRINDNDLYALKKVRMQKLSDKEKENALNEVRILASIKHPNIVAYKEAFIDEPSSSLWYLYLLNLNPITKVL